MPSFPLNYGSQSASTNFEAPPADEVRRRSNMMQNIEVPAFMRQRRRSSSRRASLKQPDQKAAKRRTSSKLTPMMIDRAERRRSSSTKQLQPPPRRESSRQSLTATSGSFASMVVTDNGSESTATKSTERVNRRTNTTATSTDTAANTSPYKIFIPGITGKARCLQKGEHADEEMSDDDTARSSLPHHGFFIPGINGTPLGLKGRKKVLCHRRNSGYNVR